jgi:hypothetical protein
MCQRRIHTYVKHQTNHQNEASMLHNAKHVLRFLKLQTYTILPMLLMFHLYSDHRILYQSIKIH